MSYFKQFCKPRFRRFGFQAATILTWILGTNTKAAELNPSPTNFFTITINSGELGENHADPYQNLGTIDVAGGTLENHETFEILNFGVLSNQLGGTINNFKTIQSEDLGTTISNAGVFNNFDSLGNGYRFTNHPTGVLNNNTGATTITKFIFTNNGTVNNTNVFSNGTASDLGLFDNNAGATVNSFPGSEFKNFGDLNNRGTFNNEGSFRSLPPFTGISGRVTNDGVFNNLAGASLINAIRFNSGGILNNDGMLSTSHFLANLPTGVINNNATGSVTINSVLSNFGAINNAGEFIFSFGGSMRDNGTYTQTAGVTQNRNKSLSSSVFDFQGGKLFGSGHLTGSVMLGGSAIIELDSTFTSQVGSFSFDSFAMTGGTVQLDLGGLVAGIDFDQLNVLGNASLAGTLDVALIDPGTGLFAPVAGDSFDILTATGGVTGTFTTENLPVLTGGLSWDVVYGANAVTLQVLSTTLPADFDGDGDVDSADLVVWQSSYGVDAGADADGDGDSDGFDFLAWQQQFTGPAAVPSATSVPEPSGIVLLVVGSLLFVSRAGYSFNHHV